MYLIEQQQDLSLDEFAFLRNLIRYISVLFFVAFVEYVWISRTLQESELDKVGKKLLKIEPVVHDAVQ